MLDSPWLDVALGVAFVWFGLSLVVSAINELINQLFSVRSKQLWAALDQMLDGSYQLRPAWSQWLFIIGHTGRPKDPGLIGPDNKVSERLYSTTTVQALENHRKPSRKTKIHNLPRKVFSQALIEMGASAAPGPAQNVGDYIAELPTPLGPQMMVLWVEAQGDLAQFRVGIETWFDSQMARLSALYRAQVRFVMLGIGVVVAVAGFGLGVRTDSLGLVSDLQRDESLRTGLSDLAAKVSDEDLATIAEQGCPPTTTRAGGGDEDPPSTSTPQYVCVAKGLATYQDINLIFDDRGVTPGATDRTFGVVWDDFWTRFGDMFSSWRSFLGVTVTAAALSFGASFWWNVMRRLVGLRQNGQTSTSA
ncbi:MAG TPA: hypothetical protein VES40_21730 [Ilumatobacteraceae bacterium]|nr:hypothetical protein [Ilumatobacteraceae bacterium]